MTIQYTKSYDNTYKKLKKYKKELEILNKIIELIENSTNFQELNNNPVAMLYDFERLKYNLNSFYSFRLNDNQIRLIISLDNNEIEKVQLVYISFNHYDNFNEKNIW